MEHTHNSQSITPKLSLAHDLQSWAAGQQTKPECSHQFYVQIIRTARRFGRLHRKLCCLRCGLTQKITIHKGNK